MQRKKLTLIDSGGSVHAVIVNRYDFTPNVGDYHCMPNGNSGTLIRVELLLDVPNEEAVNMAPPVPS